LSDLPNYKQHVQDINNQAVFEVVEALAKIMASQVKGNVKSVGLADVS
jgi:hypothetical protein